MTDRNCGGCEFNRRWANSRVVPAVYVMHTCELRQPEERYHPSYVGQHIDDVTGFLENPYQITGPGYPQNNELHVDGVHYLILNEQGIVVEEWRS